MLKVIYNKQKTMNMEARNIEIPTDLETWAVIKAVAEVVIEWLEVEIEKDLQRVREVDPENYHKMEYMHITMKKWNILMNIPMTKYIGTRKLDN